MESSAFSDDWKKETIQLIKEAHDRAGLPYYVTGPERDKRAKEAHEGVQPIMKRGTIIGVSDAITNTVQDVDAVTSDGVDNG